MDDTLRDRRLEELRASLSDSPSNEEQVEAVQTRLAEFQVTYHQAELVVELLDELDVYGWDKMLAQAMTSWLENKLGALTNEAMLDKLLPPYLERSDKLWLDYRHNLRAMVIVVRQMLHEFRPVPSNTNDH